MIKHFSPSVSITALVLMLSACGGGKTSDTTTSLQQPHSLGGKPVATQQILSRKSTSAMTVTTSGDKITFKYTDSSISADDKHFQFFINTDNNTSTGFQFDNEAWNESGADYLIEDNELYKATANGSDWDDIWNYIDDIDYTQTDGSVSMTLNKSQLQGLGAQIRVGFLLRDKNWDTEDFYPKSAQMSEFSVDTSEKDTIPPVITLNGAASMKVTLGSVFTDPGATAIDNVDGDITDNIQVFSNVDTSILGHQKINYRILDNAKNMSMVSRHVEIVNQASTGIIVDGNTDDWAGITPIGDDKNKMYIVDSKKFISLLFEFDGAPFNTQVYFDSDYNAATGLALNGPWGAAGIDYMIENAQLYKKLPGSGWSWEKAGDINYIRKDGIIEVSIPKSNFSNLASNIGVGFIKRDANWNVIPELLPKAELLTYTLNNNIQVSANIHKVLCVDTGTQALPFDDGSFEDGFEFTGVDGVKKVYSTVLKTLQSHSIYTLQVELPDGSINKIADYGRIKPRISSIHGALYFSVFTGSSETHIYRITHDDKVVLVGNSNRSHSFSRVFYINGSDYYLSLFDFGNKKPLSLKRVSYDTAGSRLVTILYDDTGNPSNERLRIHFERNDENIEQGTLYYAYTTGETRIIGVVNSSGELQPVSTCSNQ